MLWCRWIGAFFQRGQLTRPAAYQDLITEAGRKLRAATRDDRWKRFIIHTDIDLRIRTLIAEAGRKSRAATRDDQWKRFIIHTDIHLRITTLIADGRKLCAATRDDRTNGKGSLYTQIFTCVSEDPDRRGRAQVTCGLTTTIERNGRVR